MKSLERVLVSFTLIFLFSSLGLALLTITPTYASAPLEQSLVDHAAGTPDRVSSRAVTLTLLITPTNGITVTSPRPTFDWADASTDDPGGIISYTLLLTGSGAYAANITTTTSIYTPTVSLPGNGIYTWTVRAYDGAGQKSGFVTPPATFTLAEVWQIYLPVIFRPECPATSSASFDLIPIDGAAANRPDYLHADLNLSLRGYSSVNETLALVDYNGGVDSNAPQLAGLFEPNNFPGISTVYRVNHWNWDCGQPDCSGLPITDPVVTLAGFVTTAGQAIYIPERNPEIYGGGYKVMVLYAAEGRITLGYTRQDTVADGYAVHIEDVCVDPNLLALYRAQTDADGWHVTGQLPALRNNQALGTASNTQIKVAIRDRGTFMDPRSRKDWWQGY